MPLPDFQESRLDNGLRVLTSAMPHTRSVSIAIVVGGGSRYESDAEAGAFHFLEHLYFKGTPRRPSAREVSEAIEGVGGLINASTERETTVYWCKVAHVHFARALDLLSDMLRNSLFDPVEMEKERGVILEELAMSNDHPDERVGLLIDETVWPHQPMGRDVGGTPDSVRGLTRDTLLGCMARQYVPSNAVIAMAGNLSHQEALDLCASHLGAWQPGEPGPWFPAVDGQDAPRFRLEQRRTDQAHLCLALRGLPAEHPQRYALDLLGVVLGEGMSSRLFLELRERRGLVYDAHSAASHFRDTGALSIYAAMDPANAYQACRLTLEELYRLRDGVPEEEMVKAKELSKGRLLLRMEDTRSVALWLGGRALLRGDVPTVDEVAERIDAVTPEELRQVARELVVPRRMNLALVGPFRSAARFQRLLEDGPRPS